MVTTEELAHRLRNEIIDHILESSLNIQSLPDDLEREIYNKIFAVLEQNANKNVFSSIWTYLKNTLSKLVESFK